jgi:hypothetical protein
VHHHHFLEDFDKNILSRMFPNGWTSLKQEAKEESIQPNDDLLKTEKELGAGCSETFVGVHRY